MAELLINGVDAYKTWGVRMGDDFITSLFEPPTVKDYIVSESALEHGTRYVTTPGGSKLREREVTLKFTLMAEDSLTLMANLSAFIDALVSPSGDVGRERVTIRLPEVSTATFRMLYKGKSGLFGMNVARTVASVAIKFVEPDPSSR